MPVQSPQTIPFNTPPDRRSLRRREKQACHIRKPRPRIEAIQFPAGVVAHEAAAEIIDPATRVTRRARRRGPRLRAARGAWSTYEPFCVAATPARRATAAWGKLSISRYWPRAPVGVRALQAPRCPVRPDGNSMRRIDRAYVLVIEILPVATRELIGLLQFEFDVSLDPILIWDDYWSLGFAVWWWHCGVCIRRKFKPVKINEIQKKKADLYHLNSNDDCEQGFEKSECWK